MSRGDRREEIYHDDVDRQDFLKTLAEACQKTDWQVHAYCLMRNHFHLVVASVSGGLRQETAINKGDRIVAEELQRLQWTEEDLRRRRKNDPGKLRIAARLRRETILSLKSIATRVGLGSSKSANAKLHTWMQANGKPDRADASKKQKNHAKKKNRTKA